MKKDRKFLIDILSRYLLLLIVGIVGIWLFQDIFLPLTKYPSYFFLKVLFKNVSLVGNTILINNAISIEIVGACVAGSAYYFISILNLSTLGIKPFLRIKMIILSFAIFLAFNIIRIVVLSVMYVNNSPIFDTLHEILWYGVSTALVVGIWFFEVKLFGINKIPIYSDVKKLYKMSSLKKK